MVNELSKLPRSFHSLCPRASITRFRGPRKKLMPLLATSDFSMSLSPERCHVDIGRFDWSHLFSLRRYPSKCSWMVFWYFATILFLLFPPSTGLVAHPRIVPGMATGWPFSEGIENLVDCHWPPFIRHRKGNQINSEKTAGTVSLILAVFMDCSNRLWYHIWHFELCLLEEL